MAKMISMAATSLLVLGMLMAHLEITGAQSIGVCYGMNGTNLPSAPDVVALYQRQNIRRMRLYSPDQRVLQALKGSNIELILSAPNEDLQSLTNASTAKSWVQRNVLAYSPSVKFRYISVGNEVAPINEDTKQFVKFLLPAMRNLYNAIVSAGLQNLKVSTVIFSRILDPSYPPSAGAFRADAQTFIGPIISFLVSIQSSILFNVNPYYGYIRTQNIKLSYALFTNPGVEFMDTNGLGYQNLFDTMVDATYAALEKSGASNLTIVVSESGWPSAGDDAASIDNARTYNQNLINHVMNGTPKRPGRAIETYIFSMFNENLTSVERDRNFGLFFPNRQPVYQINILPDPIVTYFTCGLQHKNAP